METTTALPEVISTIRVSRLFVLIPRTDVSQTTPLPDDCILGTHQGCGGNVRRVRLERFIVQMYCEKCGLPSERNREVPYSGGLRTLVDELQRKAEARQETSIPENDHSDG